MTAPRFTPWVDAFVADARRSLAALIGVDDAAVTAFALERAEASGWLARVTVAQPEGAVTLEVFDQAMARQAWFRGARLGWGYHSPAGDDPFQRPDTARWLRALRDRALAGDRPAVMTPALREALDAVARYLPLAPGRDEDFRLLMPGPDGPVGALWLGVRCDQDCDICWQNRRAGEPPAEILSAWLDEMLAARPASIILSGGEPTLRDDLPSLVRRAKGRGAHVVLESHGMHLADAALRDALRGAGLDELVISLHSADAGVSDALTRAPGGHARTLAGLEACLRAGMPVGLHAVVDARTAEGLPAHAALVLGRLRGVRRVSYSMPTRYFDGARYRAAMAPLDLVRPHLSAAVQALRAGGVEVRVLGMSGFPLCATEEPAPQREVSDGERGGRSLGAACAGCAARTRCVGVPGDYLAVFGERGLRPRA
ncbi:MAG: radical SAM protein [Polyangiales bacterium]